MTRFRGPPLHAPFNLANVLHKGLSERPDAAAVITMDDTLSWRELDRQSDCLAKNYTALGLKAGDRVATLMPNRTALIVHHLACLKASLISTPLNYRYTASEIDHALEVAEPSLLIHHAERDADIEATARARGLPFGTLRYGAQEADPQQAGSQEAGSQEAGSQQAGAREAAPQTQRPLEPLLVSAPQVALPPIKPSSPLFIFFTSGSTGPAKGVTHTVETVGFWLVNLREGLGLREDDIIMTTTSHSYVGGTSFALLAFSLGVPLVMARTNEGAEVFPLMRKARPTITWMLPSTLFALITLPECRADDFASFRYVGSAGDKASDELEDRFEELTGLRLSELYGMTEALDIAITPSGGPNKKGSAGPLGPGVEASVRDADGTELGPGEEGRLWVRYAGNTIGYWRRPDATNEVLVDGWLDTGDVVRFDDDGYLWFRGRRKQIIVHDGSNIAPQEVEAALVAHPAVARAGVVGVDDVRHGENVWAFVTFHPDTATPTQDDLIAFARERVGYKAPDVIIALDTMPVTSVGKTDRTTLKRIAADKHTTEAVL